MIRVNLIGRTNKPARGAGRGSRPSAGSFDALPMVWGLLLLGTLAVGYFWWSGLRSESARIALETQTARTALAEFQAVIEQDAIYEERKEQLEARIAAIEELRRNRVSPVVSLDMLSQAVEQTRFVWINTLNQNNTTFNLRGTGTSLEAIESFITNLENTGYFTNISLVIGQLANPNYTFQLAMSFVPPRISGEMASRLASNGAAAPVDAGIE
jgi:Tfp pilus assembly protein PilN